ACARGAARGGLAVAEQVDGGGGRRDAFFEHGAAEQSVDERALAGVELADDDEQEQLVELADRLGERGAVVGLGLDAPERHLQLAESGTLLGEQGLLVPAEQADGHAADPSGYGPSAGVGAGAGGIAASTAAGPSSGCGPPVARSCSQTRSISGSSVARWVQPRWRAARASSVHRAAPSRRASAGSWSHAT